MEEESSVRYLVLCPTDKRIMHISTTIGYESNGNYILDTGTRVLKNIATVVKVDSVPTEIRPEKYLYRAGKFVENPDYVDPETIRSGSEETR